MNDTFPQSDAHAQDVPPAPSGVKQRSWAVLKWLLFAAVIAAVVLRARELWNPEKLKQIRLQPIWLLLSAICYLIGWLPSVWFWRALLMRMGQRVAWTQIARAYYCGQLGKYIPLKMTVLIIRSALLKEVGVPIRLTMLTVFMETLTSMGTGLAIAIVLAPQLIPQADRPNFPDWVRWVLAYPWLPAVVVIIAVIAMLPWFAKLITLVAIKLSPEKSLDVARLPGIDVKLLGVGMLAFCISWTLFGLSLGCVIQSVSENSFTLSSLAIWTGAVSAATSIGFLAIFAPGGLGVREGILMETLQAQPTFVVAQAFVVAFLLRFVWFTAEIVSASVLYWLCQPPGKPETETGA